MGKLKNTYVQLGLAVLALLVVAVVLTACGGGGATSTKTGPTALGSLKAAQSALSTMAPDAKLLVVQTAQATTPTSTPIWAYLFGSPSTDKIYVVYESGNKVMGAQESGTAGLSKDQWAKVPALTDWKIDSDVAYKNAFKAGGGTGEPNAYMMGMLTFKPQTDTSTVQPFVWAVQFDPGNSKVTTATINVNAKTGAATVEKTP